MRITYCGVSDKGLKRKVNQDAICTLQKDDTGLFVVADGMGGHAHGELASQMIITGLRSWWEEKCDSFESVNFLIQLHSLQHCIEDINKLIFESYNQEEICGSTVVALFIQNERYALLSVGDSRVYRMGKFSMKQISVDDVWENQPGIRSKMKKAELRKHPNCGKLIRAVGIKEDITLNVQVGILKSGECFLLCSDGLYKMCDEKEIKRIMKSFSEKVEQDVVIKDILQSVYQNGARDNVSAVLVEVKEH